MDRMFNHLANLVSRWAGKPQAFILAAAFILVWGLSGPLFAFSDTWQLVVNTSTTIITFLMVFIIQNSQNRDAGAMQAKLDELLRAVGGARTEFIGIEHLTEKKISEIRQRLEEDCDEDGKDDPDAGADDSVARLLSRRF